MFIRFNRIHERDGQKDEQTPHDGRPRLCIASRGKRGVVLGEYLASKFEFISTKIRCFIV